MPLAASIFEVSSARRWLTRRLGVLVTLILTVHGLHAAVLYVDRSASGSGSGASWSEAFTDLQEALAVAQAGDQVWVAGGSYTADSGTLDKMLRFEIPSGVALYGGFAGSETSITQRVFGRHESVLTGDLLGDDAPGLQNYVDNSIEILRAVATAPGTRLDGFTVRDANNLVDILGGGGLDVRNGSLAVAHCVFEGNLTLPGGAALHARAPQGPSTVSISDSTFADNHTIAGVSGGAIHLSKNVNTTITRCRFLGNVGLESGGAIFIDHAPTTIDDCYFGGNVSNGSGGAVLCADTVAVVSNCTLAGNVGAVGGAGIDLASGTLTVANCILWGDTAPAAPPGKVEISATGTLFLVHSQVQGPISQFGGDGNANTDPLLVDAAGPDGLFGTFDDDPHLRPDSPCIDSGANSGLVPDSLDADGDGDSAEPVPIDLALVGRFEDDPDVADAGGQVDPVVDRGAFEFSRWTWLDHALGAATAPWLIGFGSWKPGLPLGLQVTAAAPTALGVLFVGGFAINAPFKGGVLVPYPQFANAIVTDAAGAVASQGVLPADAPSGFPVILQAWFADPAGPSGVTATNAVSGTVE